MLSTVGFVLSLLVSFQMLFVSIFLFTHRKGNRTNNALLGVIMLMFSMNIGDLALRVSGHQFSLTALHLVDDGFFFLYGPLFYFYTVRLARGEVQWSGKYLLHGIPSVLWMLFLGGQLLIYKSSVLISFGK